MTRRLFGWLLAAWLPAAIVTAWWFVSADSDSLFFPPLQEILSRFDEAFLSGDAGSILKPSLTHLVIGYLGATVAGIAFGIAIGVNRLLRDLCSATIHFVRSVPPVALVPFAIVAFGIDSAMKIWLIAIGAFFPILLNTIDGVRAIDPLVLETTAVYRVSLPRRVLQVLLPAASPQIFAGLRVGLQVSLLLMVVSEMYAATEGIGYFILQSQSLFQIADMWAGMIMLGLLGFLLNEIFIHAERRALRWYIASRGDLNR